MSQYTIDEKVLIIEDCREGHVATGQIGTFEGYYDLETGADRNADPEDGLPRIRLQDGSAIWGIDCWWAPVREAGPLPQMQEELEEHKAFLREVLAEAGVCARCLRRRENE